MDSKSVMTLHNESKILRTAQLHYLSVQNVKLAKENRYQTEHMYQVRR